MAATSSAQSNCGSAITERGVDAAESDSSMRSGLQLVVAEDCLAPVVLALDGGGVRVQQQLVRVVPQPVLRVPWAVHAQSVAGARRRHRR